jgi:hypothetical protein
MPVAAGPEAGGHVQSTMPLRDLLPHIIGAAGGVPVVAAGGIGDGAGIAGRRSGDVPAARRSVMFPRPPRWSRGCGPSAKRLRESFLDTGA